MGGVGSSPVDGKDLNQNGYGGYIYIYGRSVAARLVVRGVRLLGRRDTHRERAFARPSHCWRGGRAGGEGANLPRSKTRGCRQPRDQGRLRVPFSLIYISILLDEATNKDMQAYDEGAANGGSLKLPMNLVPLASRWAPAPTRAENMCVHIYIYIYIYIYRERERDKETDSSSYPPAGKERAACIQTQK